MNDDSLRLSDKDQRDMFAATALASLISISNPKVLVSEKVSIETLSVSLAAQAYTMADAMMLIRDKDPSELHNSMGEACEKLKAYNLARHGFK